MPKDTTKALANQIVIEMTQLLIPLIGLYCRTRDCSGGQKMTKR